MTFQQLLYILDIRKTGSFSRTAKNFYVSQASISQAVSSLEQELGIEIFQRNWNGVLPTKQGMHILEEAGSICEHYHRLLEGGRSTVRHVQISYSPFAPLNEAFARLCRECTDDESVQIFHRNIETVEMPQALLMGEADVCISAILGHLVSSASRKRREQGLTCREFATLPAAIFISPAHPLYNKPDLSARDFEQETIIDRGLLAGDSSIKTIMDVDLSRAILVQDWALRTKLVDQGLGYMISYYTGNFGNYRCIPLDMTFVLMVMTNPQRPVPPEVRRFLELGREEIRRYGVQVRENDLC